jgi:hypothetical protein
MLFALEKKIPGWGWLESLVQDTRFALRQLSFLLRLT